MVTEISNEQIYEHFEKQQNTQYGGDFGQFEPFLLDNLSSLTLCPKCLQPHGKMRLWYGAWVEQHCDCEKKDDAKWGDGRDFNLGYETCYCCGLEVLESGSKWSPFVCQDCKKAIFQFNDAVGTCVIPFGRHHFLNSRWFNRSVPLYEPPSLFSSESKSLGELMDRERQHKTLILQHQLKILTLPVDATLMMLLKASLSVDQKKAKQEALLSLIASILHDPPKIIPCAPHIPKIESTFITEPELSCVFYTVVIRNEAINQKYEGGIKAFVAKHGVKYNNDLSVMIVMAPGDLEVIEKMLKKLDFKREEDFTWFKASEIAWRKPTVKSIPFKVKWLKGYCSKGRAYVSLKRN